LKCGRAGVRDAVRRTGWAKGKKRSLTGWKMGLPVDVLVIYKYIDRILQ
jgi:hypothetical protein